MNSIVKSIYIFTYSGVYIKFTNLFTVVKLYIKKQKRQEKEEFDKL